MRYPIDEYSKKELSSLNVKPWQIELLNYNPSYCGWGNFEDYMCKDGSGWDKRCNLPSIDDMWKLDDLNECINFYFTLYRKNHECTACEGTGLNSQTKQLSDDWYSFDKTEWVYTNNRRYNNLSWQYHLTEVEVKALVKHNRLMDLTHIYTKENGWTKKEPEYIPTPKEVNEWATTGLGHDSINQWICVEASAKHLAIYGHCEQCDGMGCVYDEPEGKVALQLWVIHPRKGCSRGVYIEEIKKTDLPKVFKFLNEAKERNENRFSKIPQ